MNELKDTGKKKKKKKDKGNLQTPKIIIRDRDLS